MPNPLPLQPMQPIENDQSDALWSEWQKYFESFESDTEETAERVSKLSIAAAEAVAIRKEMEKLPLKNMALAMSRIKLLEKKIKDLSQPKQDGSYLRLLKKHLNLENHKKTIEKINYNNAFLKRLTVGSNTNKFIQDEHGLITFKGLSRINWTKITADSVTLEFGTTPAGVVADLQTKGDGNAYHIDEATGIPGMRVIVDFVGVTAFNWVQISTYYNGSAAHAGQTVHLWNWSSSAWDNFSFCAHHATVGALSADFVNCDFFLPDDTNYIGTGGNAGEVRVRLLHLATGDVTHDHDIDVVK
jgi:hypothetical protein